jgi:leader peptidase (prepilin peptidase)/N-methyltransferase
MLFVALYHQAVVLGLAAGEPLPQCLTRFLVMAAFAVVMVIIAFIDLDHQLILDRVTYPAIPAFYGLGLLLPERSWYEGLVGVAVGYLVVRLIADGYYHLTHREGMGYGDGKLLAVVGALHGWQAVVIALFFGSVLGSVVGTAAVVLARRRSRPPADGEEELPPLRHVEVPFGPFLVVGALVYGFAAPWLRFSFGLLWGTNGGVL